MIDPCELRARLTSIVERTPSTEAVAGFWVGDAAAERRALDNLQAGRLHWKNARRLAIAGLRSLDEGDIESAFYQLEGAELLRVEALEILVKPSQIAELLKDAGLRGHSGFAERDALFAAAVSEQERLGKKGRAARRAAIKSDDRLRQGFGDMSDAGQRAALRRARAKEI